MTPGVADAEGVAAEASQDHATPAAGGPQRRRTVLVAVALVALAAGCAAGLLIAGTVLRPTVPTELSVDTGFSRDMQAHHGQAVEMSVLVRDRSQDPAVRQLALDIMLTQQQQQGQMFGWLAVWGLPQSSSQPVMAWMDEDHHGAGDVGLGEAALMPGMATSEQMARLTAAEGTEADVLYLALMIPHHVGGVDMAEAAQERATQPAVRRLAESMVLSQTAEITVLEEMLAERGGAPADL